MEDTSDPSPLTYRHIPLDSSERKIRLVKVRSDDHNNIYCDFTSFDLDQAPPFTTLSYMWGTPPPTRVILAKGRVLNIRKKLYRFLEEFCNGDEYLWVDQLCIDQDNALERSHQVRLMSSIYTRCSSVIMWLGGHSKKYMQAARDFEATSDIDALAVLLKHPYFTRLWVIQEILLPPEVGVFVGGNVWVPWSQFSETALKNTRALETRGVPYTAIALLHHRSTYACRAGIGLPSCLQLFSGNACGDPRDKVYGLMGLVRAAERVEVDYTKSPQEVYLDVVRAFCTRYLDGRDESHDQLGESGESYHLTLAELGKSMSFSNDEVVGVICFLSELFQRLDTYKYSEEEIDMPPKIDMGFEVAIEMREIDANGYDFGNEAVHRWWFEWERERRSF
ncbi:heterokaryon incompatibility protein-domain-containing protein [Paraphoma chrysanthemicola]|uniref:Heterokaryon incompatibility protein-domain-containing protein n=1 Tax=Paraphoma chrysanthemicola TaxID=798071 RepID=A0A8K0R9N3_9PLEO|nr:heterokaryon incompatibility protein-domain-containing protein [Paraphoma chrysanthemicola]